MLARVLSGARASLMAGVISVTIAVAIGGPLGVAAGWVSSWTDAIISRCTEAPLACPFLILAIALGSVMGASLTNAMIAIGIAGGAHLDPADTGADAERQDRGLRGRRSGGRPSRTAGSSFATSFRTSSRRSAVGDAHGPAGWGARAFPSSPWSSPAIAKLGRDAGGAQTSCSRASGGCRSSPAWREFTVLGFNLLGDGLRDALDAGET